MTLPRRRPGRSPTEHLRPRWPSLLQPRSADPRTFAARYFEPAVAHQRRATPSQARTHPSPKMAAVALASLVSDVPVTCGVVDAQGFADFVLTEVDEPLDEPFGDPLTAGDEQAVARA